MSTVPEVEDLLQPEHAMQQVSCASGRDLLCGGSGASVTWLIIWDPQLWYSS